MPLASSLRLAHSTNSASSARLMPPLMSNLGGSCQQLNNPDRTLRPATFLPQTTRRACISRAFPCCVACTSFLCCHISRQHCTALCSATKGDVLNLKPGSQSTSRCLQVSPASVVNNYSSGGIEEGNVDKLVRILERELPLQYEQDLTWRVYSDDVLFADPVTVTRGALQYWGMIGTIRLLCIALFDPTTVKFDLHSIQEVPPDSSTSSPYPPRERVAPGYAASAIRTTWSSTGRTRWGKQLKISGDDIFRVSSEGCIVAHESAWNESPEEVWHSFAP